MLPLHLFLAILSLCVGYIIVMLYIMITKKSSDKDGEVVVSAKPEEKSPSGFKIRLFYFLLIFIIICFTFREVGIIVWRSYGVNVLPESLRWIATLDRIILFFGDEGGTRYSMINYFMIIGALFLLGFVRQLARVHPFVEPEGVGKVVKDGKNPFFVAIPEWEEKPDPSEKPVENPVISIYEKLVEADKVVVD